MKFTECFLEEINKFTSIYCLISGGYHSTTSALLLKDYGFSNVYLVHNRTYLEMKSSLDLIQKIIYLTDYPYILVEPNLKERIGKIYKDSLNMIPEIIEYYKQNKKNIRDLIPCCRKLKKNPARRFYTKEIDKQNSVIISSLLPHESFNRNWRLKELRNNNTYIRLHRNAGYVYHAYPFRDYYSDNPFHKYLLSKGIIAEHSGCVKCPLIEAYLIYKNEKKR